MSDFFAAIKSYLYGAGWLVVCLAFCIVAFKTFDKFVPVDIRKELEEKNMAVAIMMGLFLFGLALGTLIFAGLAS